jgi:hypothetical protein
MKPAFTDTTPASGLTGTLVAEAMSAESPGESTDTLPGVELVNSTINNAVIRPEIRCVILEISMIPLSHLP